MPAAIKRRKVASMAVKNATGANIQRITTFTKVSKGGSVAKHVSEKDVSDELVGDVKLERVGSKRKASSIDEEAPESDVSSTTILQKPRLDGKRCPNQPQTPRRPKDDSQTPASFNTPTKGANSLLDRLCLFTKTPTKSPSARDDFHAESIATGDISLPEELFDLIDLHAAFLTALSLHYAHNGTNSPADLRILCPDVARVWRKRKILLEDIRRSIGLMNTVAMEGTEKKSLSKLSLSDYGHGKICVEIGLGTGTSRIARPINEESLNEVFKKGLDALWKRCKQSDLAAFVMSLPLEPVRTCSSLLKMSPLLAKGQRRLEDMRTGAITKKQVAQDTPAHTETTPGKKPTLLERLKAKQLHQSTLAPPPSKEELSRKSALQRIEEVSSVLTMLSTSNSIGQQRISFTLPTVLGKLRDSFKTPISKEEGEACVRLLASTVAPDWVRIVKMGKIEALVVNRDERPSESEIRKRVASVA